MKKVFFCGIGGIGMSALAQHTKNNNYNVSGSDKIINTDIIDKLKKKSIKIIKENKVSEEIIKTIDILIITNTVSKTHAIYLWAKKYKKKILYRSQFLNNFLENKKVISISGSHGKTTTTGITTFLLKENRIDPTAFVGGVMKDYHSNYLYGLSPYIVLEADDAYKSFLDIQQPFISIITEISHEHFETYKTIAEIKKTFLKYINQTAEEGFVIINYDNPLIKSLYKKIKSKKIIRYGSFPECEYRIKNKTISINSSKFTISKHNKDFITLNIPLQGIHNIYNTTAAIIAANILKIPKKDIYNKIINYQGVARRFEEKGVWKTYKIFDDYAHHPNEIKAVLKSLQENNQKAYIFFQPHKYTRLKFLWSDFINAFASYKDNIKKLLITDVYSAEDKYDDTYNSYNLVKEIGKHTRNVQYIKYNEKKDTFQTYQDTFSPIEDDSNTIILTLGAGRINTIIK